MMRIAVAALLLTAASTAMAQQPQQDQIDPMAYIRAIQGQRDRALADQAMAEARLAKVQAELAELRKNLESKPETDSDKH